MILCGVYTAVAYSGGPKSSNMVNQPYLLIARIDFSEKNLN